MKKIDTYQHDLDAANKVLDKIKKDNNDLVDQDSSMHKDIRDCEAKIRTSQSGIQTNESRASAAATGPGGATTKLLMASKAKEAEVQ